MKVVNMHEAKTNLSRLVDEEFLIARDGVPVARVTPIRPTHKPKRGFHMSVVVPDDFDSMFRDEIADLFSGNLRTDSPEADR